MIMKYFIVIICMLIVDVNAGKIDCKSIDLKKFNELFNFKYSGGSKGLKFDFKFTGKQNTFEVEGCNFEILFTKSGPSSDPKKMKTHPVNSKDKLSSLQGCTMYKVQLRIKNLASNKSFDYVNFVTTKPDPAITKVQLSIDNVEENQADFSYSTSATECVTKFIAILKDNMKNIVRNMTLSQNSFSFDNLTSTKFYTAQIIALDDKDNKILSNEEKFKLKSSDINNEIETIEAEMKLSNVTASSARLEWKLNDEDIDKPDFKLIITDLIGNEMYSGKITEYSANVNNLQACTKYIAKLFIADSIKPSIMNFTTAFAAPSKPENVKYFANSTTSITSWDKPKVNPNCVSSYTIEYSQFRKKNSSEPKVLQQTVEDSQTSVVFDRLPYTRKIYIFVYANYDTSDNATRDPSFGEFENFNIDDFVVTTVTEFRLSATEVQFQWSFDTSFIDSNVLNYFQVFFDDQSFNVVKNLINLNIYCNKNYTMTIRCVSKAGTIGPNVTYHTNLNDKEVQLSMMDNINVNQTNTTLMVKWKPNKYEASCIAYYEVKFAEEVFKTVEPKMEINKFDSCMIYQLSITPVSESGTRGEATIYEFETNVLVPEQPTRPILIYAGNRELKIASSISDRDKRCVGTHPTFIEFTCNDIIQRKNISRSNTQYAAIVVGLHPNTRYNCTVRLINSNGTSEKSEVASFTTLQDSPQPPNEISTMASDNTVNVTWIPNNSTGFADYYQVHVTFVKFLYDSGKDCQNPKKNKSVIEATKSSVTIHNLLPFSQYKLKILASNTYGKGNYSKEVLFNTHPSSPTEPRDINVRFQTNDNSTVSAFLSWKSPCMMNGKFSLYTISVNGYRKGVESDKRTEANTIEEIELHDLSHGFKYDIEIQAVNQKHGSATIFGSVARFSFVAPAGIPEEDDLKDWILLPQEKSPNKIDLLLKRKMFVSKVGDITGIAFLIFDSDCSDLPQPSFGYLSSSNTILPSSQGILNCTELYQQTDFLVNPLDYEHEMDEKNFDEFSVKFTLGDAACSIGSHKTKYCNGPLTCRNCGLMARVFTSTGYRDTQQVFFEVKPSLMLINSSSLLLVGGTILVAIIASFIVCMMCCISIRHKKKIKRKKESAETVDNLLSFTSYCVIDKNPTPKLQFEHLL